MAYDESFAERIRTILSSKNVAFDELKMMGGLCIKVDNKMLCGTHIDKKYGDTLLMARIGQDAYLSELNKEECLPMDFTGRPMKGYIFVTPEGFANDKELDYWIQKCLDFNPLAKASKKKKKKK